jgi:phage tail-like protein
MSVTVQEPDETTLRRICIGSDLYTAQRQIRERFPSLDEEAIDIHYTESREPRFKILSCSWDARAKQVRLEAAGANPIRHLPANFQQNEFLRDFLMIFQHIMNRNALLLDNLYRYFRPMECPSNFLAVLTQWFAVKADTFGREAILRRFLQNAFTCYRCRGTARGIKAQLALVSGVEPEIYEGILPYGTMDIQEGADVESSMFEQDAGNDCFTVYFPVLRETMDDELVKRLSRLVQEEKPVHTVCFLRFKDPPPRSRPVTTLSDDTDGKTEETQEGVILI